jgi:hypothetical protein
VRSRLTAAAKSGAVSAKVPSRSKSSARGVGSRTGFVIGACDDQAIICKKIVAIKNKIRVTPV